MRGELLVDGYTSWDIFLIDGHTYAIAKEEAKQRGCRDSVFGSVDYFVSFVSSVDAGVLTKKALELIAEAKNIKSFRER